MIYEPESRNPAAQSDVQQDQAELRLFQSLQLCVDANDPAFQAAMLVIALLLMALVLFALESCRRSQAARRAERAIHDVERAAKFNQSHIHREIAILKRSIHRLQFQETEQKIDRLVQSLPSCPVASPTATTPTAPPLYCSRSNSNEGAINRSSIDSIEPLEKTHHAKGWSRCVCPEWTFGFCRCGIEEKGDYHRTPRVDQWRRETCASREAEATPKGHRSKYKTKARPGEGATIAETFRLSKLYSAFGSDFSLEVELHQHEVEDQLDADVILYDSEQAMFREEEE